MNYVLDALTMKEADQYTILTLNIPSLKLMENAGEAIFSYIKNNIHGSKNYKYLILTGSGNNGGDGFVVGRKLLEENYKVDIFEVYKAKSNDCLYNKNLFKKDTLCHIKLLDKLINKDTIVIDAIFGYGLNKNLDEYCSNFIKKVNSLEKKLLIAVDIASGINSTTGLKMNEALISDITLTLGEAKLGLFINDGKDYNKKVVRLDIGISLIEDKLQTYIKILDKNNYKDLFIYRKENSNKGTYGKVSLIGGSKLTPGALKLSLLAYSSLKLGVGYSELCFPSSLKGLYDLNCPEIIYHKLKSKLNGSIKYNKNDLNKLLKSKVITIGMGIGVSKDVYKIIKYLLANFKNTLIIDADGLNSLSKYGIEILKEKRECSVVLTPHVKEFERLSGYSVNQIKVNRVNLSEEFASKYNVILVLKDNVTLITSPTKDKYLNVNGNSSLAKGGSGDLLSGIISGCAALDSNEVLVKKVALGSYLLGRADEIALSNDQYNEYSLLASDIVKYLNDAINEIIY